MLDDGVKAELDYHALNAMLNLYDSDGKIRFDADRKAARQYFLQHVNQNTVFFHNFEERMRFLIDNDYYEKELVDQYSIEFIERLTNEAYAMKFRFPTFLGAFKFFTSYALKTPPPIIPAPSTAISFMLWADLVWSLARFLTS